MGHLRYNILWREDWALPAQPPYRVVGLGGRREGLRQALHGEQQATTMGWPLFPALRKELVLGA